MTGVTAAPAPHNDRNTLTNPTSPDDRTGPTGDRGDVIIRLRDARRTYGEGPTTVHALDGIDLDIQAGQYVVLLGPSGSGKTTLLNVIGGIDTPTDGSVAVAGEEVRDLGRRRLTDFRRHHVAFIFQLYNLVPTLTAVENVQLIAELTGGGRSEAEAALRSVGLGAELDRFPSELSGGQQQRVAVARALAKNTPVLLCDEPTGALDQASGLQVLDLLDTLHRDHGRTIVLVTHDESIASRADRVIRMVDGRIARDTDNLVETGPARDGGHRHRHRHRDRVRDRHRGGPMSAQALLNRKLRRDLGRRRAQVVAVALTVFVGVAVFLLSGSMAANLGDSYDRTYDETAFADAWLTVPRTGGDAAASLAETVSTVDGVDRVETRTNADVGVVFADRPIRTRLTGVGPDSALNRLVVREGVDVDPDGRGVVVERTTAAHFEIGPGDTIEIVGVGEVPVVGVATSPEWLWIAPSTQEIVVDPDEFGIVFAPESLAAEAAPDARELVVTVAPDSRSDPDAYDATVADVVRTALDAGATGAVTRDGHPSNQALQGDLEGFEQLAVMFPVLFLFAAGLATAVLLGRLVVQQRGEIGMLRANGYGSGTIQRHYAGYGVVVALLGAIPAIPAGVVGGWFATDAYTGFVGVPFAARTLRPVDWLIGLAFAAVVGGVAGLRAARRATAVDPAAAMRPGVAMVAGRRNAFDRLLPRNAPSWLRLALRNLSRSPGRSLTTALGVILALILTMTALVLNDTIDEIFGTQFNRTDTRALVVTFDGPVDDERLAALRAVDGVDTVEAHVEVPISVSAVADGPADDPADGSADGSGARVPELLQVYATGTTLHDFSEVGGLAADGIVLSTVAADRLDVAVGDEVVVQAVDGTQGAVTVAAVITEPLTGSSYLSLAAWQAIGGSPPDTAALSLVDREAHAEVRDVVAEEAGVVRISDRVATAERTEELLAASRFFVGAVLFLAVLLATALIFNALAVTIGERETEVATLAANGVPGGWIRRTITTENLVTVGLGLVPGLLLGWLSADAFVGQFSTDQFILEPVLRPLSLVVTTVLLVVCALVAQVPGLRRLARLDLSAKVRERAL